MAYNVILNAARSNFARYFSQNFSSLGRTVFGKDSYMNYFQGALTPDKIVYIDKKQGQKLERLAERQLFGNYYPLLYRMFFAPSRATGVAAERTFAALGAGKYRSHTALASQKIITGMVPDEEPHGFQYIARFPFRSYFCHLYARIRKLRLEEYPVKCLKQAVCQLHLVIYRLAVRV